MIISKTEYQNQTGTKIKLQSYISGIQRLLVPHCLTTNLEALQVLLRLTLFQIVFYFNISSFACIEIIPSCIVQGVKYSFDI